MMERRGGGPDHVTVREADHVIGRGAGAAGHVTGSATDRGRDASGRRKKPVLQVTSGYTLKYFKCYLITNGPASSKEKRMKTQIAGK